MEKDNKSEIITEKDNGLSNALAFFVRDPSVWYLYKKAEKISKAFFLLTRHLPEEDVLKSRMRDKALDLISRAQMLLSSEGLVEEKARCIVLEILSLISLSDTALAAEVQSEKNHSIVVRELEKFINDLSTWSKEKVSASYIPTALFDMSDIPSFTKNESLNSVSDISKAESAKKSGGVTPSVFRSSSRQEGVSKGDTQAVQRVIKERIAPESDMRKGGRQDAILQAIRVRGEVSIKDLVAVVKGCSEKTIQRELISLVNSGILSKTGERRWSRYSVI